MYKKGMAIVSKGVQELMKHIDCPVFRFRMFLLQVWTNKWPNAHWGWWTALMWTAVNINDQVDLYAHSVRERLLIVGGIGLEPCMQSMTMLNAMLLTVKLPS